MFAIAPYNESLLGIICYCPPNISLTSSPDYYCTNGSSLDAYQICVSIAGGLFILFFSVFLTITFIFDPSFQKPYQKLISLILLYDCLLYLSWLITSADNSLIGNTTWANLLGIISLWSIVSSWLYNLCFCKYLASKIGSDLHSKDPQIRMYIFVNTLVSLLLIVILYTQGGIGRTLYGTSSLAYTCTSSFINYFGVLLAFSYMILGIIAGFISKKRLSDPQFMFSNVTKHYISYMITSALLYSVIGVTELFSLVQANQCQCNPNPEKILFDINFSAKLLTTAVLCFLSKGDPSAGRALKDSWRSFLRRDRVKSRERLLVGAENMN